MPFAALSPQQEPWALANAQLRVHTSTFSRLFSLPHPPPRNIDLGLLSPCAFKEVLRSPQQEPGQEMFLWRQLKDLLASSTSWMCTEL